jgi:four helix bundle protein
VTPEELKKRTKAFAINAIRLGDALPNTRSGNIVANQFIRSATSVGANYRAACRARSDADFASKIGVTLEEADESAFWLEIVAESGMKPTQQIAPLLKEGNELVAIFVASSNTVRNRLGKNSKSK